MTFVEPIDVTPIEFMPEDPFMESSNMPRPDTPFTYTGEGVQPTWNDVYNAAETEFAKGAPIAPNAKTDPFYNYAFNAGKAAVGESIKAMSGFVNQLSAQAVEQTNTLLSIYSANVGVVNEKFASVVRGLDRTIAVVNFISLYVVPNLQAQISQLKHDLPLYIEYAALSERNWTVENIFRPLYVELLKVQPAIDTSIAKNNVTERARTDTQIAAKIAPVAALVATLAPVVSALQTESSECVQPMCSAMGPNTNLGKFLKGLNLAADAALIAALLAMTESELVALIREVTGRLAGVVNDFEQFAAPGGETIAGLITAAGGSVL